MEIKKSEGTFAFLDLVLCECKISPHRVMEGGLGYKLLRFWEVIGSWGP